MKFLLQNNCIGVHVAKHSVVLKIFFDHFIGNVTCAPDPVPDRPKVTSPVPFGKCWVFFLQPTRSAPFQPFNNITYVQRWPVLDMDMYMVFTYNPFKYFHALRIANLLNKISASLLDIPFQNFIPIFCNPNYEGRKPRYRVATCSLIFTHKVKSAICVATASLALKEHSFN